MGLQHDDTSPNAPAARQRGWLRATIVAALAINEIPLRTSNEAPVPTQITAEAAAPAGKPEPVTAGSVARD